MKRLILILILATTISSAFGQSSPEENKIRTYEISLINHPQKVKLTEYENGKFSVRNNRDYKR